MAYIKGPGAWQQQDDAQQSGVIGGGEGQQPPGAGGAAVNPAWTNLQQYLSSNAGAGAGIANAATSNAQGDIDAIGQKQKDFEKKAQDDIDAHTRKDIYSSQVNDDPTKINQADFASWKASGPYSGQAQNAQGFDGYGDIEGNISNAKNDINTANTFEGQQALANKTFGKQGNYTQGMNLLDTFVGAADPTGKQAYQNFQTKNAGLGQAWQDTQGRINSGIANAKVAGQSAYDNLMKTIGGKIKDINANADRRGDQQGVDDYATYANQVQKQLENAGAPSNDISKYVVLADPGGYKTSDLYNQADVDALNTLAGMDDDPATSSYAKTDGHGFNVDQKALDEFIASTKKPVIDPQEQIDKNYQTDQLGRMADDRIRNNVMMPDSFGGLMDRFKDPIGSSKALIKDAENPYESTNRAAKPFTNILQKNTEFPDIGGAVNKFKKKLKF